MVWSTLGLERHCSIQPSSSLKKRTKLAHYTPSLRLTVPPLRSYPRNMTIPGGFGATLIGGLVSAMYLLFSSHLPFDVHISLQGYMA
ncbi:hypothetical protein PISMIDRAFT_612626 [Pisolithus microcarpus 441]|uniref:Uncharacterized protein n=1 Tax=Pisolithus microcarpus 441 TaxID=765257 RepID=A0A0D0A1H9_9AGAM|nr:hypothetical protein PISMIDRAFT_612626 [Pisolithus microcarpus 441]